MNKHDLKVLVLTPIYPGEGIKKSSTPVVHYFVREWVKQGVDVRVIHYPSNFPMVVNMLAKPFRNIIGSKAGYEVRTWQLSEAQYEIENVKVKRIPLIKLKPHARYSEREIVKATTKTISYCEAEGFRPDVITSHWVNPQLDIMHRLKSHFGCRVGFVAHDAGIDLKGIYSKESKTFLADVDVIGYRSDAIKRMFEARFHTESKPHFYCYSGIPSKYVDEHLNRKISNRNTLLFVGTLIERKYPSALVAASMKAFQDNDFQITYIGTGHEENTISQEAKRLGVADKINMLGRVERDEVVRQMDLHTIFAMISRAETFGLVYLEAMARGCITIASRDEGFDGIIRDGENGFLCKAGDSAELAAILSRIKAMPQEKLQEISSKAVATAFELTDEKTAATYLQNLLQEKHD